MDTETNGQTYKQHHTITLELMYTPIQLDSEQQQPSSPSTTAALMLATAINAVIIIIMMIIIIQTCGTTSAEKDKRTVVR